MDSMNSMIMMLLILGIIYVAFTYLKGPANSDRNRNNPGTGMPFGPGDGRGEMWHDNAPELPQNDEMEMEPDGEDMEEIRYEDEAEEDGEENVPENVPDAVAASTQATPPVDTPDAEAATVAFSVKVPAVEAPADEPPAVAAGSANAEAGTENQSAPAASMPETPVGFGTVIVDSEVHIDADMSPGSKD
jgi:hypothetical protein